MKFGREKLWELKHAAYKDVMNDFWDIYAWCSAFDDNDGDPTTASSAQEKRYGEVYRSFRRHILLGELIISKRAINLLHNFDSLLIQVRGNFKNEWDEAKQTENRMEMEINTVLVNVMIAEEIKKLVNIYMKELRKESQRHLRWPQCIYSICMFFIKDQRYNQNVNLRFSRISYKEYNKEIR